MDEIRLFYDLLTFNVISSRLAGQVKMFNGMPMAPGL